AGLAPAAGALAAADPGELVARAAGRDSTVEGTELGAESVDVLHDVDLADGGPVGGAAGAGRRTDRPDSGPVPGRPAASDVGLLQRRLEAKLAAGRCGEVGALGLDPAAGPVAGAVPDRLDEQVPLAVPEHVGGAVGHGFDLTGTPVRGAAGV